MIEREGAVSGATPSSRPWQPIAEGSLTARATEAVTAIQQALDETMPAACPSGTSAELRAALDGSFAAGAAGQALFHAWCGAWGEAHTSRALARAREVLERVPLDPDLFTGFVGIAWVHAHLRGLGDEGDDSLDAIDTALLGMLDHGALPVHFDLVNGLAGLAVHAVERLPRPAARTLLARIIDRFEERAEPVPGGRAWRTPPAFADPERGHGPFDLGMAHGLAGVVTVLAAACAWDIEADRSAALLADAVGALNAARLHGAEGRFPATTGDGARRTPARLAWCYGDAGIAAALQIAAEVRSERAWAEDAREIARAAASRDLVSSGVRDAGLCHGAAGLALVFQRLHHATGEPGCADAARRWLEEALALRRPGESCGGFPAALVSRAGTLTRAADPGLLRGAAGVGLALLAATTASEPTWDRALLLSIRRP